MSAMWCCTKCGEMGMGHAPEVHLYRNCDMLQGGEELARARCEAWNAALEAALAAFDEPAPAWVGDAGDVREAIIERITALRREVTP